MKINQPGKIERNRFIEYGKMIEDNERVSLKLKTNV